MDLLTDTCDFEEIELSDDYAGKVKATLIKPKTNTGNRKSILFLHGIIDYFFHHHVIKEFNQFGFDVYGLDLRKHGRSYLEHQRLYYCKSLDEYFEEITYSLKRIRSITDQPIFLAGHSTGGLTASLYMNKGEAKDLVTGLLLNSPLLELPISKPLKQITRAACMVFLNVHSEMPVLWNVRRYVGKTYIRQHVVKGGEWNFNIDWKGGKPFWLYYSWLDAVIKGTDFLHHKSNITVPVLLMHSWKSYTGGYESDKVLNVEDLKKHGPKLGNNVQLLEIEKGVHDIFCSRKEVRDYAFKQSAEWAEKVMKNS